VPGVAFWHFISTELRVRGLNISVVRPTTLRALGHPSFYSCATRQTFGRVGVIVRFWLFEAFIQFHLVEEKAVATLATVGTGLSVQPLDNPSVSAPSKYESRFRRLVSLSPIEVSNAVAANSVAGPDKPMHNFCARTDRHSKSRCVDIVRLKNKLGITLDDTEGLLTERQFAKASGFSQIAKYRKRGNIKPRGCAIVNSGIRPFYDLDQIEELKEKLKKRSK